MHEVFAAMAAYNRNVNAVVCGHAGRLAAWQFGKKLQAYYPTIPATLLHVMSSDAKWLGRLAQFRASAFDAAALEEFKRSCEEDSDLAFKERERLFALRRELDGEIVALIGAIGEGDLAKDVTIAFGQGSLTLTLWKLLYQWFNHHTHHRGQLSLHLDMLGVENDFSKVLDKI